MKNIKKQLQELDYRTSLKRVLRYLNTHNVTAMFVMAGLLVGFSLMQVRSLTQQASDPAAVDTSSDTGDSGVVVPLVKIKLDEATLARLELIKNDVDVSISSNIASYRRSAFSDSTDEDQWVISTAGQLEQYALDYGLYPSTDQVTSKLSSIFPSFNPNDPSGIPLNENGSSYVYQGSNCSADGCSEFILRSTFSDGSIYQLGAHDYSRRDWVNTQAAALSAYKLSNNNYPVEKKFIEEMTDFYAGFLSGSTPITQDAGVLQFYFDNKGGQFEPNDISGVAVNEEDSDYRYIGVDCDNDSCNSYILRAIFSDDASYFQQSTN